MSPNTVAAGIGMVEAIFGARFGTYSPRDASDLAHHEAALRDVRAIWSDDVQHGATIALVNAVLANVGPWSNEHGDECAATTHAFASSLVSEFGRINANRIRDAAKFYFAMRALIDASI